MRPNVVAIALAIILFGGLFYFYRDGAPSIKPSTDTNQSPSNQNQMSTSTATNYEECITEGNAPLPDAPDKCLTTNGHLFIQGVVE